MASILPVPGSQPTDFWVSVTTHPNVVAMKQAVSGAFESLKQLWERLWTMLADSGAVAISVGLATGCWIVGFVDESKARKLERIGLYVGLFWVEMKGAWNRAKLEAENGQLKQQNQQVVTQNAQLNTQIHTIRAQHTVEKQVQSAELTSLKTNLEAAREREVAAIPEQVTQQTELTELRAEVSRLKTQKTAVDQRMNEFETRAVTAEHQLQLNPNYEKLAAVFNGILEARKENRNLGTDFARLKLELEDYQANYKRTLPGSEPAVDHLIQIARNAITASEFQAKMEALLQSRLSPSPSRVKPANPFQQEIVS